MKKFDKTKYDTQYVKENMKRIEIRIRNEKYQQITKKLSNKTVQEFLREKLDELLQSE